MEDLKAPTQSGPPRLRGSLAEALKDGRERYNARFRQARRFNRQLDPSAFSAHLLENLAPIVDAVAPVRPERVDALVETLYDLSLDLVGKSWLGPNARQPTLNTLWRAHLPKLAAILADDPRRTAGALTHAAYTLAEHDAPAADRWMARIAELAPFCPDADTLLNAGKVLAWRAGLAHYRTSALAVWRGLADELRYQTLVLSPADEPALLDQNQRPALSALDTALVDPWFHPARHGLQRDKDVELSTRPVGGFRGFGAQFSAPPRVNVVGETLFAYDGYACFSVHADAFGSAVQKYGLEPPVPKDKVNPVDLAPFEARNLDKFWARNPALADYTSIATLSSTVAVTVAHSHKIFLIY